jgi:hypothetical protein
MIDGEAYDVRPAMKVAAIEIAYRKAVSIQAKRACRCKEFHSENEGTNAKNRKASQSTTPPSPITNVRPKSVL